MSDVCYYKAFLEQACDKAACSDVRRQATTRGGHILEHSWCSEVMYTYALLGGIHFQPPYI
jgi:hypothetical protein